MAMNFQPCASSFGNWSEMTVGFGGLSIWSSMSSRRNTLGDVQRALMKRESVRTVEARGDHFHLAFPVLLADGIDLGEEARANEHRTLVADPERAGVADAAREDLDVKALR